MSTRCRIGIQNKDGTITSIYCHHDGYPSYVGDVLVNHYKDEDKIRKLLELGDLSSLGTEPIANPDGWKSISELQKPRETWEQTWQRVHSENACVSYKTRGEEGVDAQTHKDIKEYQRFSRDCWGEYTYLFKDGTWYVLEYDDEELKPVANLLKD